MTVKSKFYGVLSCAWTAFIFFNSLQSGGVSSNTSGGIVTFISNIMQKIGINTDTSTITLVVRKSGHFIEFLILAVLITLCYVYNGKRINFYMLNILFFCLAVAVSDEYIQTFVQDRTGLVTDIIIDFSGAVMGVLIVILATMKRPKKLRRF